MSKANVKFDGVGVPSEHLPNPTGWRILLGMIHIEEKSAGGIVLTQEYIQGQEYLRNKAIVLEKGPLCYESEKYLEAGASAENRKPKHWCEVGDIVEIGQYDGQLTSTEYEGVSHSLKTVNDDGILSVWTKATT